MKIVVSHFQPAVVSPGLNVIQMNVKKRAGSFSEMGDTDSHTGTSELSLQKRLVLSLIKQKVNPDLRRCLASCRDVMINATIEEFSRQKKYYYRKEDDSSKSSC